MFGSGDFRRDLELLLHRIEHEPLAFSRFGDGEWYVCNNKPLRVENDGWATTEKAWLPPRLVASLQFDMPGYLVGISPSCCQTFATDYYVQNMRVEWTYATIFSNANAKRAKEGLQDIKNRTGAIVVSPDSTDFPVPKNAVEAPWDLDGLVTKLLDVDVPIFVAAGPAACVIAHQVWLRGRHKHSVIDVGAVLTGASRTYLDPHHPSASHECSFMGSGKKLSRIKERAMVSPSPKVRVKSR